MGKLLAFMFVVNLVMALTALPALAVVLERLLPRKHPARVASLMTHGTENAGVAAPKGSS
jgi:hypothetical protein